MRTASDKKNQFVDLWAKKKIYLYFWQLRCSSQVTSYLDMLIESFGLMKDYFFFLLISKKISNLAVQVKTATEPSGASVALLGSRLKVEIKPEMEARDQKNHAGYI